MRKALAALTVALLVLVAAGCGGAKHDDKKLSKSDQRVSNNIADYIVAKSQDTWKKSEAQCLSDKFVATAGVPKIKKAKLVTSSGKVSERPSPFDKSLATDFGNAYTSCVDYAALTGRQLAKARPDLDQKKFVACVRTKVSKTVARDRIIAQQMNKTSDPAYQKSNQTLIGCAKDSVAGPKQ